MGAYEVVMRCMGLRALHVGAYEVVMRCMGLRALHVGAYGAKSSAVHVGTCI